MLDKSVVGSEANRQTPPGIPLLSEGPLTTTDDDAASEPSDNLHTSGLAKIDFRREVQNSSNDGINTKKCEI